MAVVSARDYFETIFADGDPSTSGLCSPRPIRAHRVRAGETIKTMRSWGDEDDITVPQNGWIVDLFGPGLRFMSDDDFASDFEVWTGEWGPAGPLPEGTVIEQVRKGEEMTVWPHGDNGAPVTTQAGCDGVLVTLANSRPRFMNEAEFFAWYDAGPDVKPLNPEENCFLQLKGLAPLLAFVKVPKGVELEFANSGRVLFDEPHFLVEDPRDEDGFIWYPERAFRAGFMTGPERSEAGVVTHGAPGSAASRAERRPPPGGMAPR